MSNLRSLLPTTDPHVTELYNSPPKCGPRPTLPRETVVVLERFYKQGMDNHKTCRTLIEKAIAETGLAQERVKNWIMNRRAKDRRGQKRSATDEEDDNISVNGSLSNGTPPPSRNTSTFKTAKPISLLKPRTLSGFNRFVSEFHHSRDMKRDVVDAPLHEQNRRAGEIWKQMSEDERKPYNEEAAEMSARHEMAREAFIEDDTARREFLREALNSIEKLLNLLVPQGAAFVFSCISPHDKVCFERFSPGAGQEMLHIISKSNTLSALWHLTLGPAALARCKDDGSGVSGNLVSNSMDFGGFREGSVGLFGYSDDDESNYAVSPSTSAPFAAYIAGMLPGITHQPIPAPRMYSPGSSVLKPGNALMETGLGGAPTSSLNQGDDMTGSKRKKGDVQMDAATAAAIAAVSDGLRKVHRDNVHGEPGTLGMEHVNRPFSSFDCVVLDIEGTTTPISFVHDVLFPYIDDRIEDFVAEKWGDEQMMEFVRALRAQADQDVIDGHPGAVVIPLTHEEAGIYLGSESEKQMTIVSVQEAVVASVRWQMSSNRKAGPLKALQGFMWKDGYMSGELKGVVYDDVVPALEHWNKTGARVYIYSSGSVAAQKLLFGYSDKGDLLKYFCSHFDTNVGPKTESTSYDGIANAIECNPSRILFVSDNTKELLAARTAGYQVALADRPGNAPVSEEERSLYYTVTNFTQLCDGGLEHGFSVDGMVDSVFPEHHHTTSDTHHHQQHPSHHQHEGLAEEDRGSGDGMVGEGSSGKRKA